MGGLRGLGSRQVDADDLWQRRRCRRASFDALDRRQPGLPLKKGRAGPLTHDYKWHGTTALFAALNVLDGQVISQWQACHRHGERLKFLRQIDRETPRTRRFI